jgi:hypothetical protein
MIEWEASEKNILRETGTIPFSTLSTSLTGRL